MELSSDNEHKGTNSLIEGRYKRSEEDDKRAREEQEATGALSLRDSDEGAV